MFAHVRRRRSSTASALDNAGRVWAAAHDGLHCFDPDGTLIGKLRIPEVVSNLTFGGAKRNQLFITRLQLAVLAARQRHRRPLPRVKGFLDQIVEFAICDTAWEADDAGVAEPDLTSHPSRCGPWPGAPGPRPGCCGTAARSKPPSPADHRELRGGLVAGWISPTACR